MHFDLFDPPSHIPPRRPRLRMKGATTNMSDVAKQIESKDMNRNRWHIMCACIVGEDGEIEGFCVHHMKAINRFTRPLEEKLAEAQRIANELKDMPQALSEERQKRIKLELKLDLAYSRFVKLAESANTILNEIRH